MQVVHNVRCNRCNIDAKKDLIEVCGIRICKGCLSVGLAAINTEKLKEEKNVKSS